jgi:hypothetical protein
MTAGAASAWALWASADTDLGSDPEGVAPACPILGPARPQLGAEGWIRGLKRCPVTLAWEPAGDLPSKSQMTGKTIRRECVVLFNFKVVGKDDERAFLVRDGRFERLLGPGLVQFAIRAAVAIRTLDEILAARDTIDREVRSYVTERTGASGVEIGEIGVMYISSAGRMDMKVIDTPASVPSRAARGVILRTIGATKPPIINLKLWKKTHTRPASQPLIGSPVLMLIGSMITNVTMNMCGTLIPEGSAHTSARPVRYPSR